MREILFRAKTEPNSKDVITGEIIKNPKWVCGYVDLGYADVAIISSISGNRAYRCDPATVGQYTGLADKNGMKIFEGDIVRHHNDNPYALPSIFEKGKVYWDEQYCGWRRTSNGAFHHGEDYTYRMSHECVYEVIGNIHDNPELFEEVQ